jgi:hypothetical protein
VRIRTLLACAAAALCVSPGLARAAADSPRLLAQLDAFGANRSALVSEALREWMARRRIESLDAAYAHLATLEAGDLGAAGEDAVAMGLQALAGEADG